MLSSFRLFLARKPQCHRRIAEEDEGTEFLIERYREAVAIVMVAAAHKRKWRCNSPEHLQDVWRFWPIRKRHKQTIMKDEAEDQSVLKVIQQLAAEEHHLYEHEALTDADRARLTKINVELDQCWDLLRQRQALRDAGRNPDEAHVRPPETVENYEQ
jgi:hypothetical protein